MSDTSYMTVDMVPMSDDEIHAEHEVEKALQLHLENSRNAWVAACKDIGLTPAQADDVFHQALDHESRLAIPSRVLHVGVEKYGIAVIDDAMSPLGIDDQVRQVIDGYPAIPEDVCRAIRIALQCEREKGYDEGCADGYDEALQDGCC